MFRYTKNTIVAVLLASAGAIAYADFNTKDIAAAIVQAKISMVQAITAAELHANGKAVRAEYEQTMTGGWVYNVEVISATQMFDVKVDANTGAIISAIEDKAGPNDDKENKNEQDKED